ELNSKLVAEIAELRKENAEIKAENIKLKQAMEGSFIPFRVEIAPARRKLVNAMTIWNRGDFEPHNLRFLL
ncbi:8191_t:CDS:1, partial [Paraglomus occultum]